MKLLLLLATANLGLAQDRPAFEAASVKLNTSGEGGMSMRGGGSQLEWTNASLRYLVQVAYRLHEFDYSAPAWLDSVCVDIVANLPPQHRNDSWPEMLQTLLAGRFKLAVHRQTREMPGLALVMDKKGFHAEPAEGEGASWSSGPNVVQGKNVTMAQFADALESALDRPVQDMTALSGRYNLKIQWKPDMPSSNDEADLPGSVYAAVQELGLRLQAQKIPVEVLVVDHAERVPTEN
jgi:uncharacterized protein (TIGR03435 family)